MSPAITYANEEQPRTLTGAVGLIEMPSARMAPDGELSAAFSALKDNQHYNLNFQALPWLDVSFRYSALQRFAGVSVYFDRSFAFKARLLQEGAYFPAIAFGVNDLVGTGIYSGEYIVASKQFGAVDASLGLGFGRLATANTVKNPFALISSAFDKRVDNNTGVGQFSFGKYFRGPQAGVFGGLLWHTPVQGLSLMAEYSSDSYREEQAEGQPFKPKSQVNIGAAYRVFDNTTIGLSWVYGRSLGINLSFDADPEAGQNGRIGAPPVLPRIRTEEEQRLALQSLSRGQNQPNYFATQDTNTLVDALWRAGATEVEIKDGILEIYVSGNYAENICARTAAELLLHHVSVDAIVISESNGMVARKRCAYRPPAVAFTPSQPTHNDRAVLSIASSPSLPRVIDARGPDMSRALSNIKSEIQKQSLDVQAMSLQNNEAIIYYANKHYSSEADAVNRMTRVLMREAPPNIEHFRFILTEAGIPQTEFSVLRGPIERTWEQTNTISLTEDGNTIQPAPIENPLLARDRRGTYPRFTWGLFPQLRQELFDPANPMAFQLVAGLSASTEVLPGLSIIASAESSVFDNFNTYRKSDSLLPHVRTDFLTYVEKGKNGISDLEMNYRFRLAPDVYGLVRAGYLESMFAGIGGEVLWRPWGWRWALGMDIYGVRQRNFDRLFGLQPYQTVTGHVSLYYNSPWYGLDFAVRAGRYLANDSGVTMEVTRRFSTGIEVGAFITKTNITAAQFGEGSFDKGIIIRIPIDWMLPIDTQSQFAMDIRPLQRDGGARLAGDATLFEATRGGSLDEIQLRSHNFTN